MIQQQQQPIGLKYGYLFKCSHTMKRWTNTWFVLGAHHLTYYNSPESPKVIDLQQTISIVSADVEDSKRPHSFKLSSPSFSRTLIVAAETSETAEEWIAAIRSVAAIYAPPPEDAKGPVKLSPDQREMLQCSSDICMSVGKIVPEAAQSKVPGLYVKGFLDPLSSAAIQVATTGRVVVFKPKIQSGMQRFSTAVADVQMQVVKYKGAVRSALRKGGKGKNADPHLEIVATELDALVKLVHKTITKWMPDLLDPDLTKTDDAAAEGGAEAEEAEAEEERETEATSPYISPFFVNPSASPPPCRKHWDLLADECTNLVSHMETLSASQSKGEETPYHLKLPAPITIQQARQFLFLSREMHGSPALPNPPDEVIRSVLADDTFSLLKQQLLGSTYAIDYHATNIGFISNERSPPQLVDVISHAQGISSALAKIPRAIRKHRGKTLVSVVENIGSFTLSLSKLVTQLIDHENFLRDPERYRQCLRDEVHAVQYIAIHMLSQCPTLLRDNFAHAQDLVHFFDTAKLLALSVTNLLESIRAQLAPQHKRKRDSPARKPMRKLASELTDAATGSMVFWFGLVGREASVLLAR